MRIQETQEYFFSPNLLSASFEFGNLRSSCIYSHF